MNTPDLLEKTFDAFIVLNDSNPQEVHMVSDSLGENALAIYPRLNSVVDEDGEPFKRTRVVPCTITYKTTFISSILGVCK